MARLPATMALRDPSTPPLRIGPPPPTWRQAAAAWLRAAPGRVRDGVRAAGPVGWCLIALWAAGVLALAVTGLVRGDEQTAWLALAGLLAAMPFLMVATVVLFGLSIAAHVLALLGLLIGLEWLILRFVPIRSDVQTRSRARPAGSRPGRDPLGYYAILGLDPRASGRMARMAYRRAARRNHPDLGGDVVRMAKVNAAWEVIGDAEARAAYDAGAVRL